MSTTNAISALKNLHILDLKKAEMLFALAILNAQHGYRRVAKGYAEECISLLKRIGTNTLEDCVTNLISLEGVAMPEFLHENVVRVRLESYDIHIDSSNEQKGGI